MASRKNVDQEVSAILAIFEALEKVVPEVVFPGFDTEGEDATDLAYEGWHHSCAEEYRPIMEGRMKPLPYKSHGRHLSDYRQMIALWTKWGRPKELTEDQAKELIAVGRIYIPAA